MKPRRNSKSEENRAAAASLLVDLEEEFSPKPEMPVESFIMGREEILKPTDNLLKTYGNTAEIVMPKPTEILRKMVAIDAVEILKPTDKPTDLVRKSYGKPTDLWSLVGLQRQAFFALAQQAKELGFSDDAGNRITPPINGNIFALECLKKPYKRAKDVLYELKIAGFLTVYKVKNGRGGFVQFLIQKTHYQSFLLGDDFAKPTENRLETYGKPTGKPTDKPTEAIPCSSSTSLNTNNTTTTEEPFWLSVPEKLRGQIPVNQLRAMLKSGVIDQETLEDSLWGFAHDLENGLVKSKTNNPTAVFIGAIKNGGYISQQYLAQKQAELKDVQERVAELKKIRSELEASRLLEEFESFKKDFPQAAESLKPMSSYITNFETGSIGYKLWLDEFKKRHVVLAQPAGHDEIESEGAL